MASDSSASTLAGNQLHTASSSYLRSARHQPVHWHPWGETAFARARAENKPILLDIGAVWCHWCHVMDRESYEDAEIARIINENFIAVKVDRDERPDVDMRYQAAVSAISQQGGWPLTAFLTPDGRPYFGGTYFPRDDRYGRPGFGRVLLTMAQVWRERREEALESAASVMVAIEHNESFAARSADLNLGLVDKIAASAIAQFDARNGGFGSQPKFPHPGVLDLLLEVALHRGNQEAQQAFIVTLERMARGGVYDQLAGGFHRYSVDERWIVPHFEKMLYDNTELLRNYVHAFQSFVRTDFRQTAEEIIAWLDAVMTDRDKGGFYASQDADINLEDDGDYFTWTLDEASAVLSADELGVASRYWDIGELGDMHHNPAKNVLHRKFTVEEVATQTGRSAEEAQNLIDSSREKLIAARALRPTPFIDRTLYTSWNAMAVSAYFDAARVFRAESPRAFALLTLNRLLAEAWDGADALDHVIAYGESDGDAAAERVPGTLDDYAMTVHACIDGWIATGEMRFYNAAAKLADVMIAKFYDRTGGAFFDTAAPSDGSIPLGALTARRKPLQDSPTPAGNPTAASALLRLEELSGRGNYRQIAEETLQSFAGVVEHFGLYAGSYGLALERLLVYPAQIIVVGECPKADQFEALAMAGYAVNKTVVRLHPDELAAGELPEALAETVMQVPKPEGAAVWVLICRGRKCMPPITEVEALLKALE
ncbi:thioredoxin domain-containing protein [Telmatobacter sp. DSM 110680]|uniref:Thioredoxin domain-containing protein n=1 Tax=Telmatobacter sp. DSM 110680 TaxID=3036704 RepID=A0AAU7DHI7_9BACT